MSVEVGFLQTRWNGRGHGQNAQANQAGSY
jgi:hypothetical protein